MVLNFEPSVNFSSSHFLVALFPYHLPLWDTFTSHTMTLFFIASLLCLPTQWKLEEDRQRLTNHKDRRVSPPPCRTTMVPVIDDAGNDGCNTGVLGITDRTIWIWPSKEWRLGHLFVTWRMAGWKFFREDTSLA